MNKYKIIIQFLVIVFPGKYRNRILNACLDWDLNDEAKISRISLIMVNKFSAGKGAWLGPLTVVKGLDHLILKDHSGIGRLNWITGYPKDKKDSFSHVEGRDPSLYIYEHASITNRHIIDCTDKVEIGAYSTFAGFRSQILTHSIDLRLSRQSCKPVIIGEYNFVGTGVTLLGGCVLGENCIVGAGSVLGAGNYESNVLIGGVPAKIIKSLDCADFQYFSREKGSVS